MRALANLVRVLEDAGDAGARSKALANYFRAAPAEDAAWVIHFALGGRVSRALPQPILERCVCEASATPRWMLEHCLSHAGDGAETLALLLPSTPGAPPSDSRESRGVLELALQLHDRLAPTAMQTHGLSLRGNSEANAFYSLSELIEQALPALRRGDVPSQMLVLSQTWNRLAPAERILWHELIQGRLQFGVSRTEIIDALAATAELPPSLVEERLAFNWQPSGESFRALLAPSIDSRPRQEPRLAPRIHRLTNPSDELGPIDAWHFEWAWDGLSVQIARSANGCSIWADQHGWVTSRFLEIASWVLSLPANTCVEGTIVALRNNAFMPATALQRRLAGHRTSTAAIRETPVAFALTDLLECAGEDLRLIPFTERRDRFERLLNPSRPGRMGPPTADLDLFGATLPASVRDDTSISMIRLSPRLVPGSWAEADQLRRVARQHGALGLLMRPLEAKAQSPALSDQDGYWLWPHDPIHAHMLLVAARPREDHPLGPLCVLSFAVRDGPHLVTVCQTSEGLSDADRAEVDAFVREHRIGRFGPVHTVEPRLVFEIAFDSILGSSRHRSGVVLGNPRIARWLRSLDPQEAETLVRLREEAVATGSGAINGG